MQTSDGRERLIDYILLMPHDGEVALWDYWDGCQRDLGSSADLPGQQL